MHIKFNLRLFLTKRSAAATSFLGKKIEQYSCVWRSLATCVCETKNFRSLNTLVSRARINYKRLRFVTLKLLQFFLPRFLNCVWRLFGSSVTWIYWKNYEGWSHKRSMIDFKFTAVSIEDHHQLDVNDKFSPYQDGKQKEKKRDFKL